MRRLSIAAVVTAVLTLGCTDPANVDPGGYAFGESKWIGCDTADIPPGGPAPGQMKRCVVTVDARIRNNKCETSNAWVTPSQLSLDNGMQAKIVWVLDNKFMFCPRKRDGAYLKGTDPKRQFSGWDYEDGDHGSLPDGCRRKYVVTNANTADSSLDVFKYNLQFRLVENPDKVCELDPWIRNG